MLSLGLISGLLLGVLLMNLVVEDEKNANQLLKKVINKLQDENLLANTKIKNRDKLIKNYRKEHEILLMNAVEQIAKIKDYQEENVILLNNSAELRSKVTDLENNVEFLANNLSENNKELADLRQSD